MTMLTAEHDHVFLGKDHDRNARRTWMVIAITTAMMVVEIAAGTIYGSMALVADGWHMSTHAGALLIAALAYYFARRQSANPRFTFGTGKLGDLGAFASAVVLALVALLIGWESLVRLANPVEIGFSQAILVAVVGLAVNLVSAWLLHQSGDHGHAHHGHSHHDHGHTHPHPHDHHHDHAHDHAHGHHHPHPHAATHGARDNNLRAAYLHVMADALTSVLAIAALLLGSAFGWQWLDPAMGVVGALVIARWSWTLIRDAGAVLLDYNPAAATLPQAIRTTIETGGDTINDLHVWQVGPGHHAAIVSLSSADPQPVDTYRRRLAAITGLSHITVEVDRRVPS